MRLFTPMGWIGAIRRASLRGEGRRRVPQRYIPEGADRHLEERALLSTAAPYKIDLQQVDFGSPRSDVHKLGIYVGLGGGAPKLYEFDTGGEGFWASYNPALTSDQWWGNAKVEGQSNLTISYSSGNTYVANQVQTSVQLYDASPSGTSGGEVVGTTQDVDLGQITSYSDPTHPAAVASWNAALADGAGPLEGGFYGDFGASLAPSGTDASNSLLSILPQIPMPPGLADGFYIHLGSGSSDDPSYLQLGLTPADIKTFHTQLEMTHTKAPEPGTFPVTGVPTYSQQVTHANFSWADPKTHKGQTFHDVGWTIDTGALPVNIWQGSGLRVNPSFLKRPKTSASVETGTFKKGLDFTVTASSGIAGKPDLTMKIDGTGGTPADNKVTAQYHKKASMGRDYVNTGMLTFKRYDVLYDLSDDIIGFRRPQSD